MSQPTATKVPFGLGFTNIVLGGLQLALCVLYGFLLILAIVDVPVWVPGALAVSLLFLLLGIAGGALLLIGGIGLVKYRNWGRITSIVAAVVELVIGAIVAVFAIKAVDNGAAVAAIVLTMLCLIVIAYPIVLLVMLNSKQAIAALDGQRAAGGAPARSSSPLGTPYPSTVPAGPERGGAAMPYGTPPRAGVTLQPKP